MKKVYLLLALVGLSTNLSSQKITGKLSEDLNQKQFDSINFQNVLQRHFTGVLNGENNGLGNFATLQTKDEIATFSGTFQVNEKSNLSLSFKGGVTEGVSQLLKGDDVNPNISVGVQYNVGLFSNTSTITTSATDSYNLIQSLDSLDNIEIKIEVDTSIILPTLRYKYTKLLSDSLKLIDKKNKIQGLNDLEASITKDSIQIAIKNIEVERKILASKIAKYSNEENLNLEKSRILNNTTNKIDDKKTNLIDNLKLEKFTLHWISFFGRLNNKSFFLFEDKLEYENQINKINYNQLEFGLSGNIFHKSDNPLGTVFTSLEFKYIRTNNFSELSKSINTDVKKFEDENETRSNSKTYTVYSGEYKENISSLGISLNTYWFLDKHNMIALHIKPYLVNNFSDFNSENLEIGLFATFKNKDKTKSNINSELFYDLREINKETSDENLDEKLTDRSILGIRFTFPINF